MGARRRQLGLFNLGWALVHGHGVARDLDGGLAAWRSARDLAPADGAEEAAYHLFLERHAMSPAQRDAAEPRACLRLAAALGFEPALEVEAA